MRAPVSSVKVKAPPEAELLEAAPVDDDDDVETIDAREVSDDAETIDTRQVSDDAETIDDREVADAAPSNIEASVAPVEEEESKSAPKSALDELVAKPASKPIVPMYDEDLDDSPTVALSSPMSSPVPTLNALASRPPAPPASRSLPPLSRPPVSRPLAPPPSRAPSAPPSAVRLPPIAPPPASRTSSPRSSSPALSLPVPPVPTVLSADASSSARLSSIPPVAESVLPPPPRRSKLPMFALAAAALAVVGAGVAVGGKALGFGGAKTGTIVVTAAGPGGKAVDGIKVFADGNLKCDTSPCRIEGLTTGAHFVHAEAPGYEPTAARAVSVESGNEAVLNIDLASTAAPAPKADDAPVAKKDAPKAAEEVASTSLDKLAQESEKPSAAAARPALNKPVQGKVSSKSDATKPEPAAAAKLNINSIPRANVVLDGRPLGMTPQIGVSVSPGSHTVVFVHPELGRKVASTSVKAGGTSSVGVRFQ